MKVTELARRYAKAVYEIAFENKTIDKVLADLREMESVISKDHEIFQFLTNPSFKASVRVEVIDKALSAKAQTISSEVRDLLLLLAKRDRISIFAEIVAAFEMQTDAANNVCRGTVRSAVALGQDERARIEATVEKVVKKKVIMTYKVDPAVIGGLIAQAGSYTFDDTIASHLHRMNEELKRRTV